MSGFANQIVGGQSNLVRPAIKSPNYVHNVSGWTINKDGSAEFSDIDVRGTISFEPSPDGDDPPNIIWDDGLPYPARIFEGIARDLIIRAGGTVAGAAGGAADVPSIQMSAYNPGGGGNQGDVNITSGKDADFAIGNQDGALVVSNGDDLHIGASAGTVFLDDTTVAQSDLAIQGSLQAGSGPIGKYYYEELLCSAQAVLNSTNTNIANLNPGQIMSDYGSCFNLVTGLWTCPATGPYIFTVYVTYTAWVAGSRSIATFTNATSGLIFGEIDTPTSSARGPACVTTEKFFQAGDTMQFKCVQTTGATRTIQTGGSSPSYVSVGRRL